MSREEAKAIAAEVHAAHPGVPQAQVEAIVGKHLRKSGLDHFITGLTSPAAWLTGLLSMWLDSIVTEDQLLRFLSGLTLGAAIEAISNYLKDMGVKPVTPEIPVTRPGAEALITQPETVDVAHRFMSGVISELKSQGVSPTVLERQRQNAAYRVALRSPRLKMMIV